MTGGRVSAPVFSYFYSHLLELEPQIKRKFTKPKGVYVGTINGKQEYYTELSPLPQRGKETLAVNSKNQQKEENNENVEDLDKTFDKNSNDENIETEEEKGEEIGNDIVELYENLESSTDNYMKEKEEDIANEVEELF